jgi:hypothetical protein
VQSYVSVTKGSSSIKGNDAPKPKPLATAATTADLEAVGVDNKVLLTFCTPRMWCLLLQTARQTATLPPLASNWQQPATAFVHTAALAVRVDNICVVVHPLSPFSNTHLPVAGHVPARASPHR